MPLILALLLGLTVPVPALAWGFEAHKLIADRMIALLPAELRPLFEKHRAFIVERSVDPDLWRTAGFEAEPPNHFLDIDHQAFGPYPFEGLPRDYDKAVEKFGREFVHEQGLLPWRVQEFAGRLQRTFASLARPNPSPYALDDIVFFGALLAHYVADGHVPLHAVVNYDGQLTGQHGLHGRWESELFERYRAALTIAPAPLAPVGDPRAFMFDVLLASNRLADGVFVADRRAAEGRQFYDDGYFAALKDESLPVLERRVNDSIAAVAAVIAGAWDRAGRPAVPTELPRTPRRIRRP
jgi:hypothetical protein